MVGGGVVNWGCRTMRLFLGCYERKNTWAGGLRYGSFVRCEKCIMQIERSHGREGESGEQESNPKFFGQAISVEKNKVGFDGWVILGDAK